MDQILAGQTLTVPTLLVHSLWGAEDIYGAMAVYKAIKPHDTATGTPDEKVFLAMGSWHHGGSIEPNASIGALPLPEEEAQWFRATWDSIRLSGTQHHGQHF